MLNSSAAPMLRYAQATDKSRIMALWATDFENYEPYFSWYFSRVYRSERTVCAIVEQQIVATIQLAPYLVSLSGKPTPIAYLVGVITDPAYRHQGIAGQLMQFALSELTKTGYAAALLYTDIPKFYRPFGFTHHYGLRQIQITPTLTQVNAHWQERQINFSTIRDCSQVYQRMCTDFNGYILRNHQNWQILLEELQCDGGKIYVFNQEAYLLAYPEKENLIIREIGYTNQDTLFETLKLAQNLAITAEIPSLRWNAPLSAPLSAQFGGTTIPFVMACALGCHSYAAFTPQNWINEYT